MWERDTTKKCRDVNLANMAIIKDSTSYNIMELEEDSHYTITVTTNKGGIAVNGSITEVTAKAGKGTSCGLVYDRNLCPFFQLHLRLPHVSVQLKRLPLASLFYGNQWTVSIIMETQQATQCGMGYKAME